MTLGGLGLRRTRALVVCALGIGCGRAQLAVVDGTLADVASPTLVLEGDAIHPRLAVSNVDDRAGRCLRLTRLRATVNGEDRELAVAGGATPEGNGCAPASFALHPGADPSQSADVIEVRDATYLLSARFPNVLTRSNWRIRPPDSAAPGDSFLVAVAPTPAQGLSPTDAATFLVVTIDGEQLPRTLLSSGDLLVTLPPSASLHETDVWISSDQSEIAALECSASRCRATSQVHLRAPLRIAR